ncbi:uncharacterized protein LAESUDRAFT_653427 [Laetiporus sulphureus 93-53]|uniref:Uncharacterized protein n=1 Tax=Laetiporus sulphureus 93-53 TaxID=1314785 RepID=A0A165E9Y9_9APHY|nr:uncharacterized protein LAESUDRAFT_653427 [Laetiporus sulphureus 93-53]KZT06561.1 hypothetical protein LAESUDRAFT_653427 [Laetiporus sulphureus 93-53]
MRADEFTGDLDSPKAPKSLKLQNSDSSNAILDKKLDRVLSQAVHSDPSLEELLHLSPVSVEEDILPQFDSIARSLVQDHHLVVSNGATRTAYQILELELYYFRPGCHEDPFTHGSEEQKESGQWYFHRAPRKSITSLDSPVGTNGYRGGTRKGLDLTISSSRTRVSQGFAAETSDASSKRPKDRGGVLLRTIRRCSDAKVISGPSLLVDEILRASGASSITELVTVKWKGCISAFPPTAQDKGFEETPVISLSLERIERFPDTMRPRIFRSPRIGLDLSNPDIPSDRPLTHPRVIFVSRPYRFFIHPHLLTANGRGQTFLGVYRSCESCGTMDEYQLLNEVVRLTGLKMPTAVKYLSEYKRGVTAGELRTFIGASGKGASASPMSFLKLMGILQRLQGDLNSVSQVALDGRCTSYT